MPYVSRKRIQADSINVSHKQIRRSPHRQGATPANTFEADDKNVRHRHIRQSPHRQGASPARCAPQTKSAQKVLTGAKTICSHLPNKQTTSLDAQSRQGVTNILLHSCPSKASLTPFTTHTTLLPEDTTVSCELRAMPRLSR